ncbi:kisspeptin 2 isoform X2 [Phyllopteryx taeniolatus]|uniref:kisspeptin 2 isoform X2 n=1 Tax=Phyllopteryx taeniolatus TaxID=161469 RepID=UPI002AD342F5|nr:kisspeptin 2 isoform X2 [Phyllopteryx taeniolatus]
MFTFKAEILWCLGASLSGFLAEQELQGTGSIRTRRSTVGDFLEDPNLCFSLRENDTQQQHQQHLLCNDHRNKFNINPFGLRFGKRYNHGYIYRRAVQRARASRFSPPTLFRRQLEVLT